MHAPHSRQISDGSPKGIETLRSFPRPIKPIAPAPICSLHILTHNPHSRQSSNFGVKRNFSMPISAARSWTGLLVGHRARRSSTIIFLACMTLFVSVRTTIPSCTGRVHEAVNWPLPPSRMTSTRHTRHEPYGSRPSWWHSVGILMPINLAASRTVVPSGMSIFIPSIVTFAMV